MAEEFIDPEQWPALVRRPEARLLSARAAKVRERLEELILDKGISLAPETDDGQARFFVDDGLMLDRIVASGWLGLAEGYMAGEWSADPLPEVLRILLSRSLESRLGAVASRRAVRISREVHSGELPDALVELYSGTTRATGSALFASGVRTSETVSSTQLGRMVPMVVSWMDAPTHIDSADLDDAQLNRINHMLDLAKVGPGDLLLELPSSGGALAVVAARRGARVDVLTSDPDHAEVVRSRAHAAGVGGAVRVETVRGPLPTPRQWSGKYDAIFSVERMETLGEEGVSQFFGAVERMLARGGIAVVQSVVSAESVAEQGLSADIVAQSLAVMQAYVWPSLSYLTSTNIMERANKAGLEVVRQVHMGSHLALTLSLWRSAFSAQDRQAAAAGFDSVYRRLWTYQLALHEALVTAGSLDCMEFVLRRSGRSR